MSYFIAEGSTQKGPFTVEQLKAQNMGPDTLVWKEGSPNWLPAGQVEELILAGVVAGPASPGAAVAPFPPPPTPSLPYGGAPLTGAVPPYNPANSNRIAAGVCGILLGGLGVHKFILGMNTAGLIMLLVSIIGGTLTCGAGWIVMHIIGLIEGIMYLTKTDEEFYNLYVVQKKEWF